MSYGMQSRLFLASVFPCTITSSRFSGYSGIAPAFDVPHELSKAFYLKSTPDQQIFSEINRISHPIIRKTKDAPNISIWAL